MKKIISLLSVIAMICTMFTTVAFADDNNKFYIEKAVDGTNVTLTFYLKTNLTLGSASGALDLTNAYAACDSIAAAPVEATVFSVNATQKVVSWTLTSVEGATGTITLGTLTLTNVKSTFTMPQKRAFTAKDSTKANVVSSFTNEQVGYEVEAATPSLTGTQTVNVGTFSTENYTAPYVKVSLGSDAKNYFLPDGVKGVATVYGILTYNADTVKTGTFTLELCETGATSGTEIATVDAATATVQ